MGLVTPMAQQPFDNEQAATERSTSPPPASAGSKAKSDLQSMSWKEILAEEEKSQARRREAEQAERLARERLREQAEVERVLSLKRIWSGPTYPERMMTLEPMLPSNYLVYDWPTKLRIRTLRLEDVESLISAAHQDDEFLVADTIGRCIDQPVGDLTIGDYYYLLYWLKLNSFTKSPMLIKWGCPACEEREKIRRDLPKDYQWTLVEQQSFKRTSQIVGNKPQIIPLNAADLIDLPAEIALPRVKHRIQFLDWVAATKPTPERRRTAEYAMYLKGENFRDRLDYLLSTDDLSLYETAMAASFRLAEHGPSELANVKCSIQECGAEYEVPLVIQPTRFLSPV